MVHGQYCRADKVRGNDGQIVISLTFKVTATVVAPRIVRVTPQTIGGTNLFVGDESNCYQCCTY